MAYQGRRAKAEKRQHTWIYIVLIVLLVVVVAVIWWLFNSANKSPEQLDNSLLANESQSNIGDGVISTPYGELTLSSVWTDKVVGEGKTVGSDYLIEVFSKTSDVKTKLYTVRFGNTTETGYLMGTIEADGAVVNVSVEMEEISADSSWPDGAYEELCGMQESVNDLIDQLDTIAGFTSSN